jgi:hypothetical protein
VINYPAAPTGQNIATKLTARTAIVDRPTPDDDRVVSAALRALGETRESVFDVKVTRSRNGASVTVRIQTS